MKISNFRNFVNENLKTPTKERIKETLIKRIYFLKEYSIFDNVRTPEGFRAQRISYHGGLKKIIDGEIFEFPVYNVSSDIFYYPYQVNDNVFHYFIINNQFHISQPKNMDDLFFKVYRLGMKHLEEKFSYRKEIMIKEGERLDSKKINEIINEMNRTLFDFERQTEELGVPIF